GRVKVNLGQIEQVILNLAANARDAIQHGGKLTIQTKDVYVREGYSQHHAAVAPGRYVSLAIRTLVKAWTRTPSRGFSSLISRQKREVREPAWDWRLSTVLSIRMGDIFGSIVSPNMARNLRFTCLGLRRLLLPPNPPR